jgi:hypothetical protein
MYLPKKFRQYVASHTITADENLSVQVCKHRGIIVDIEVTASVDTPSVVFNIQGKDQGSATPTYTTLLASAAVTGTGHTRLVVYPGAIAVTNVVANQPMPYQWRLQADGTWAGTDAITYTAFITEID